MIHATTEDTCVTNNSINETELEITFYYLCVKLESVGARGFKGIDNMQGSQ